MQRKDILQMCFQNLLRRKARTFLTVLGVLIGCCSIVIMVSIGIGMKESQEKLLREMGDLTIITVSAPQGGRGKARLDDAAVRKFSSITGVTAVTPKMGMDDYTLSLYAGANDRYTADWATLAGLEGKSLPEMGYSVIRGEPLPAAAAALPGSAMTVLAGQYLAYNFKDTLRPEGANTIDRWSSMDATGKITDLPEPYFDPLKTPVVLEIDTGNGKLRYTLNVSGVVKEDYSKGSETSEGIILRLEDMKQILEQVQAKAGTSKKLAYSSILVKTADITKVASAEDAIKKLGYVTSSMESIRRPMEKEAQQKQLMLGGLGAISLFVAALGITNTMIMSISERTREIGIMKSLGCYVRDIRVMFLTEAGAIGLLGGLVGCVLSFLISVVINLFGLGGLSPGNLLAAAAGGEGVSRISIIPVWLLGFAVVFSVVIGVGSGYYPANKAVKIPALEAIKSE
jgi:ABC-type antimicrobial peptide transport system permease subunit